MFTITVRESSLDVRIWSLHCKSWASIGSVYKSCLLVWFHIIIRWLSIAFEPVSKQIKWRWTVIEIIQYNHGDVNFPQKRNIFRHLKLEIAIAIPALNEWKIEANNSAAKNLAPRSILQTLIEIIIPQIVCLNHLLVGFYLYHYLLLVDVLTAYNQLSVNYLRLMLITSRGNLTRILLGAVMKW